MAAGAASSPSLPWGVPTASGLRREIRAGAGAGGVNSCNALPWSHDIRPSNPHKAGTEKVGNSPTRGVGVGRSKRCHA